MGVGFRALQTCSGTPGFGRFFAGDNNPENKFPEVPGKLSEPTYRTHIESLFYIPLPSHLYLLAEYSPMVFAYEMPKVSLGAKVGAERVSL